VGSSGVIPDGSRVLLDSVALIYFFERHPTYGALAREILERVVGGTLGAVITTLALSEVLVTEYRRSARDAQGLRREIVSLPNLEVVPVTIPVADLAARLRAAHSLATPDAIHVATALTAGAEWVVSNDRRMKRIEAEPVRLWLFEEHLARAALH
jgi:predicted nucleic acid-binding protein